MSDERPLAIFLMGPTASGKTDLAVELCRELPCDIISVDSALIYRGMNIGTAKPEPEVLKAAPHKLIDILDPWESYSVAAFYQDALREMDLIRAQGRIPLLVGGTMMYFRVLRDGIAALPSADEAVRSAIVAEAQQHGWEHMHAQLASIDPESAARIKPTDPQRLQRALEVFRVSGKTMSELWAQQSSVADAHSSNESLNENDSGKEVAKESGKEGKANYTISERGLPPIPYKIVNLAIAPSERSVLHERIAQRFNLMLDAGFLDEVRGFHASERLRSDMPSMRCVGYRQVWDYLEGLLDYSGMVERGIIATRQLAKRQLTWLRSWPHVHWLESGDKKVLVKALKIIKEATS